MKATGTRTASGTILPVTLLVTTPTMKRTTKILPTYNVSGAEPRELIFEIRNQPAVIRGQDEIDYPDQRNFQVLANVRVALGMKGTWHGQ
jgi:hypothetical protein